MIEKEIAVLRIHKPRNAGKLVEVREDEEMDSALESPEGLLIHLDL